MRAADLGGGRVAVWGLGREGRAAIGLLRAAHPAMPLLLLDDASDARAPDGLGGIDCAFGAAAIARAVDRLDVIVKSPGVSLYRDEIRAARARGVAVTSLLNLWFAETRGLATICITGTKGKSTTAALIAHILGKLGRRVALAGNIGVPITEIDENGADCAVIELSSYQVADFDGTCDIAVLTSLYPEHIDWHGSVESYYRDKLNLLAHGRAVVVNRDAAARIAAIDRRWTFFNDPNGLHVRDGAPFDAGNEIGAVASPYLARPHNLSNLCAALSVGKLLGIDPRAALDAAAGFQPLPHRQQELGARGGLLFVNDSISTVPESAIAALSVYAGRCVTLIVGGYDRGIDYGGLVERIAAGGAAAVICLGAAGERIYEQARALARGSACGLYRARSMAEAIACAKRVTPAGGVVLLSPAAPSYGHYRDFAERGADFAAEAGFPTSTSGDGR
jgi:UDP-N-acetylmuramoylalanine--D-glutamate ligase